MFHVKHRAGIANYAILQNDPMDQKFVLGFQTHRVDQFRYNGDRKRRFSAARPANRARSRPDSAGHRRVDEIHEDYDLKHENCFYLSSRDGAAFSGDSAPTRREESAGPGDRSVVTPAKAGAHVPEACVYGFRLSPE